MTDWTSISLSETQKEELDKYRPDGESWGEFLIREIATDNEPPQQTVELNDEQLRDVLEDILNEQLSGEVPPTQNTQVSDSDDEIPEGDIEELNANIQKVIEIAEQTRNTADSLESILKDMRIP